MTSQGPVSHRWMPQSSRALSRDTGAFTKKNGYCSVDLKWASCTDLLRQPPFLLFLTVLKVQFRTFACPRSGSIARRLKPSCLWKVRAVDCAAILSFISCRKVMESGAKYQWQCVWSTRYWRKIAISPPPTRDAKLQVVGVIARFRQ